jgi:hypothetical protein
MGIDFKEVTPSTERPLTVEIPMHSLINEDPGSEE